jgi:hypothetical protein
MNRIEFAANEISRETQSGGLSAGYATMMSEAKPMSKPDQAELTQDLVKNGTLPKLSLAFLEDDMKNNGLTSIDKQGVADLKTAADKSGNPLQAAMADSLDNNFDSAAETRRVAGGRFGVMKTAIFADTLADGIQASAGGIGSPPESEVPTTQPAGGGAGPAKGGDQSAAPAPPNAADGDINEQVKSGDSYWSLAEHALGLPDNKQLDKQQDRQIFGLMQTLQNQNGNAMLQPGDNVTIQASDIKAARS